jgi:hypothetical protein
VLRRPEPALALGTGGRPASIHPPGVPDLPFSRRSPGARFLSLSHSPFAQRGFCVQCTFILPAVPLRFSFPLKFHLTTFPYRYLTSAHLTERHLIRRLFTSLNIVEFVQRSACSCEGTHFTQEEIVQIPFYGGQGKSIRETVLFVNRGKTAVDHILIRYEDLFKPAPRFAKPARVSHSRFMPHERAFPRHYSLYILAVDPTLSVWQIAEKLN